MMPGEGRRGWASSLVDMVDDFFFPLFFWCMFWEARGEKRVGIR